MNIRLGVTCIDLVINVICLNTLHVTMQQQFHLEGFGVYDYY